MITSKKKIKKQKKSFLFLIFKKGDRSPISLNAAIEEQLIRS